MGGGSGITFKVSNISYIARIDFKSKTVDIIDKRVPNEFSALGYDDGGTFKIDDILEFSVKYNAKKAIEYYKDFFSDVELKQMLAESLGLTSLKGVKLTSIEISYPEIDFKEMRWAGFGGRGGSGIKKGDVVVDKIEQLDGGDYLNIDGFSISYEYDGTEYNEWVNYNFGDNYLLEKLEKIFEYSLEERVMIAGERFSGWWTDIFDAEVSNEEIADTLEYNYEEEIEYEINLYKEKNNITTNITILEFVEKDLISDELKSRAEDMAWESHWDYVRGEYV